ncbi:MAG: YihY/virulence factor BrkB family protein [Acidobacteria bacterium]|nr:MAG: YihY/virulence factor BrkB family protein [Acidobacteriota bacterium]
MVNLIFSMLKDTVNEFIEDDCATMAAALSYYTVFSLPPLLVLVIMVASTFVDPEDFRGRLQQQMGSLVGAQGTEQIKVMIAQADKPGSGGALATILGVAALIFGATGAFVQLQAALNQAWEVQPDPNRSTVRNYLLKRLLSFGMVLALAFILMVSLVVSTLVSAFGNALAAFLPSGMSALFLEGFNQTVSLVVFTILFGAIFKFLPDAIISWTEVWVGGFATAVLFVLGKILIGLYLGNSDPVSAYGAAASLAVVFVWAYYSSMILLFGAEFTQVWARRYRTEIQPEPGAVRVVRQKYVKRD